ncbi:MAG TPA: hypothetical protein VMR25_06030, partial [Planctomycetaceae bacterium]|nr:hypothetical protein [Planctomycetaceae bacterium]
WDDPGNLLGLLVPPSWGMALGVASLGIIWRKSWGFLAAMICHLLLEFVGWVIAAGLIGAWAIAQVGTDKEARGWSGLLLLFGLMWLPLLLPSAWAFFYLRRQRKIFKD